MMKKIKSTSKLLAAIVVLGLTFYSCSTNDEPIEGENQTSDTTEVQRSAEVDAIEVVLGDIIIDAYEGQEADTAGRTSQQTSIPECVTITVVVQQNFREVTLDFGDEGCLVHGHILKGQIVFTYSRDPEAQEVLISYNLIDFFFDAKNVLGSRTILKQLSNENGNPQFTHTLDLTVIWPNGAQASREGQKVREWVEGFGSGLFSDNVFEITGYWNTTFINGNTHTYEVLTPLRREVICYYFVSGSIDVQRTNFGGVFDYGDGDCDNQATFTFNNGEEISITLN